MTALLRVSDEDDNAIINASQAARVLEGSSGSDVHDEPQVDMKNGDVLAAAADGADDTASQAKLASVTESRFAQSSPQQVPAEDATPGQRANATAPELQHVLNAAAALGIASERYMAYAAKGWGPGWKINALGRRRALAEIESFRNDRQAFADKVSAALDALSQ